MTDRYNPLVHEVNATVRMGANPDGAYVLASDYNLLVTEHEKTEAELAHSLKCQADANGAVFRTSGQLATAERRIATLESELATVTGAYLGMERERDALAVALRLALPVARENLPKSHDAYQAIKAALASSETKGEQG